MGFGSQCFHEVQTALYTGKNSHHPCSALDFLVEPLQHIGTFHVLMASAGQSVEGQDLANVLFHPVGELGIFCLPGEKARLTSLVSPRRYRTGDS